MSVSVRREPVMSGLRCAQAFVPCCDHDSPLARRRACQRPKEQPVWAGYELKGYRVLADETCRGVSAFSER